jgi:hypothetical protein
MRAEGMLRRNRIGKQKSNLPSGKGLVFAFFLPEAKRSGQGSIRAGP